MPPRRWEHTACKVAFFTGYRPWLGDTDHKAMAVRAMAPEQKDVVLSIQTEPNSEFEAVFQQENQNDQAFISQKPSALQS